MSGFPFPVIRLGCRHRYPGTGVTASTSREASSLIAGSGERGFTGTRAACRAEVGGGFPFPVARRLRRNLVSVSDFAAAGFAGV